MAATAPLGLILAAPRSGSGKTTVSLGLVRALRRRGIPVQAFKCGPDYIDARFLSAASGRDAANLDCWAMRPELIRQLATDHGAEADLCLVEGVMGLFDGAGHRGQCGNGSTADLAALTGWPAILVLDIGAQAETAAAVALGCKTYRDDVRLAGVILNNVAGARHETVVRDAIERIGLPVLGAVARDRELTLPERHLGLVQATETEDLERRLDQMADAIENAVELDRILAAAQPLQMQAVGATGAGGPSLRPPGQRIALAQDQAFSFIYPHLLAGWRAAGAEVFPFSPLADEAPAPDCDAVWLPGGYPELHGEGLEQAMQFKRGMREAAARGVPVHGECGGYMVLGQGLISADGSRHEMLGLLGLETSFADRRLHLGYRLARLVAPEGAPTGDALFGHEFHYATVTANPDAPLAEIRDASGSIVSDSGSRRGSVTGAFFHLIDSDEG